MRVKAVVQRNRHMSGPMQNMLFGMSAIADGLIRVLSLGRLHTTFMSWASARAVIKHLDKMKRIQELERSVMTGSRRTFGE